LSVEVRRRDCGDGSGRDCCRRRDIGRRGASIKQPHFLCLYPRQRCIFCRQGRNLHRPALAPVHPPRETAADKTASNAEAKSTGEGLMLQRKKLGGWSKTLAVAAVAVLGGLAFAPRTGAADKVVKIGITLPLTGADA